MKKLLWIGVLAATVSCKSEAPAGGGGGRDATAGDVHHRMTDRGTDENEGGGGGSPDVSPGPPDTGLGGDSGGCGLITCQSAHAQCGMMGDGCGNIINCGFCTAPQSCGGGGIQNVCGGIDNCHPRTCAQAGANCGPVADECGNLVQCGSCTLPETCGAGGPSVCGLPGSTADGGTSCIAKTCASLGVHCGQAGDGCGNILDCGSCPAPETCGGGGTPSTCGGMSGCIPATCSSIGANCGVVANGCGMTLNCGTCSVGTCGGGGTPNVCGTIPDAGPGCVARNCASIGANCGPVGDGCGGTLNCGMCTAPEVCGGGGTASVCGSSGINCTPRTCAQAGANCGPVADGCGGVLMCGNCTAPQICGGGGVPSLCGGGGPPPCTNLCMRQTTCSGGGTTSVSGTVVAPTPPRFGNPDPLYNALVYVPNGAVQPFPPGVSCDRCGAPASGAPLVSTVTGPDGTFTLNNMPTGANIPLVIQLGRWRRQITIDNVPACQNTPLTLDQTRLPRNQMEGDIPLMAMVTGNVDTLECVLEKIGIDDTEFTVPGYVGGTGRIQFYIANGSDVMPGAPNEDNLWGTGANNRLATYDLVLFACEGMPNMELATSQRRVIDYTNLGGRVFATHYSYSWLYNVTPFQGTANWNVNQRFPPDPQTGILDTSFPKGMAFAQWIQIVGAASGPDQITIHAPRHDLDGVVAPAQRWIYTDPPVSTIQHYTFNTPVGTPADQQCGRVLFSDFHVNDIMMSSGLFFPQECSPDPMTAQEKILEFMLFDLASCIQPDMPPPPMCVPRTCMQIGANCGPAGDGCGGQLDCGMCMSPQTCGGGGQPSVCGGMACVPRTCQQQGFNCGPAGDGCGGSIASCGMCSAPDTCGGGGMPGVCGHRSLDAGMCVPETCGQQMISCGPAGDGCGSLIQCGNCTPPDTCGGGGVHGQCGHPTCMPRTCAQAGATCGPVADGCGGLLNCGSCTPPQTCGGGGIPSVCGGACVPSTCAQQGLSCGPAGDGCGGTIFCGQCTAPQTCGGGGAPGQCGGNNGCMPTTCEAQGANCGFISDGCGNAINCGTCPAGSVCGANGHPNQCGVHA